MRDLVWDGDRVCGMEGQSAGGGTRRAQARFVIGAGVRRSREARLVDAPTYHSRPALTFGSYSYWSGIAMDGVELYPRAGQAIVAHVTTDALVYVAAA